ncbi:MAG TPA: IS1634 family transposase [Giesbergeria sp.]|nr:IS1634 family transposase [Giesbergeria sp.]HNN17945.1 IS1634 family transposase [Giesbergeria sp.]
MFIKTTRSGGHSYVQLVESYRNEEGKPRQRTVATLGRLDEVGGGVDSLLAGLMRATGRGLVGRSESPQVSFESALALGDVWALDQLWKELGFDSLAGVFRRARYTTPVEHAIRVMVFNRLCDADSKLGVLRWLETVSLPEVNTAAMTHQHLLRSMDALMDHSSAVDEVVAGLLRPLVDQDLSLVFYDLTTIRAAGLSEQDDDVRQFGMSKEGLIARQFMLGVVQTAEGLPIYHEVFDGNQAESPTLIPTLKKVLERFPHIQRLIVVADRGLLSLDNIEELGKVKLPGDRVLEFILAVPGRRYGDFVELLQDFQRKAADAADEVIGEVKWEGLRLVVAHQPDKAKEQSQLRNARIAEIETKAAQWAGKLDGQDAGEHARGRKLSDSGAKARLYHEVCDAHLARIVKVDLKSELFSYSIDEGAKARAQMMDGKLLLVSNVADLTPTEVVSRYKALADIERGFRVLKSEIEIAPVYHRLPQRIRAHAQICFMALIIYRVMRQRLKLAKSELSPERALAQLRRIQRHQVSINAATPITGISTIDNRQAEILAALSINKPTADTQLNLL